MMSRTRYFVIASLLVLGVGLGTGLVAYFVGLPGVGTVQGGPDELQYVPRTATVVAFANVREVMTSDLRRSLREALPPHDNGQQELERQTGINVEADIDMLKAKVDAGASRAITQFFFENDLYFRYLDRVRARGIDIPIVPGILPVQNFKATTGFAQRCGASVPVWLAERFHGLDQDATTRKLIAAAVAAEQVIDLFDRGVTNFHFYTMNRADLVYAICHLLGLRPAAQEAA